MTETITVELAGMESEFDAYVIHTESGVNIELVNHPVVIDYDASPEVTE